MGHVSASQIKKFAGNEPLKQSGGCKRRWRYSRIEREPGSPYTAFGKRGHKQAERYLRDRIAPDYTTDEGRSLTAGLGYLPAHNDVVAVEYEFSFNYDGVQYVGAMDVVSNWTPGEVVITTDHKFTGDFKWSHTPATLLEDPQWILYAAVLVYFLGVKYVAGNWVYYLRATGQRRPDAKPVGVCQDADTIRRRFHRLHLEVGRYISVGLQYPIEAFPRNTDECNAYKRLCPYFWHCKQTMPLSDLVKIRV